MHKDSSPHAVIFDMDGLLLDTERVCLECYIQTRRQYNLPDAPEVFLQCVGLRSAPSNQIIRSNLTDAVDLNTFNASWDKRIAEQLSRGIPVKEGALELLKILAAQGYPLAVATSTKTDTARAHLQKVGLLPYLKVVVGGDLVTQGKPNPEVYHKTASLLGLYAKDCVAFEDSATGTRAAVASGARTVQIPDLIPPTDELKSLGHLIAPDLLSGAHAIGLLTTTDIREASHRPSTQ